MVVRVSLQAPVQGRLAGRGGEDLVARALQGQAEEVEGVPVIVHDQDSCLGRGADDRHGHRGEAAGQGRGGVREREDEGDAGALVGAGLEVGLGVVAYFIMYIVLISVFPDRTGSCHPR